MTPGPVTVSGFITESKGVSQAARLTLLGLERAGYAPISHNIRSALDHGPGGKAELPSQGRGGVWVLHCNAPEAVTALATINKQSWRGLYRIGYWVCELPTIPRSWVKASRFFHEIWVPSEFVAKALRDSGVETNISIMPHPVALGRVAAKPDRDRFNLPSDAFCVLAMGDLLSSAARKNLLGAIAIFRAAFPEPSKGAHLTVKVMNSTQSDFAALAERVSGGRPDIRFFTENLSEDGVQSLIASCDVLLSPHRAEGFGLVLAEALMLGVPPLATGWSGNVDFMGGLQELMIDYELTQVDDPFGVYTSRQLKWAEPSANDAVQKLLALAGSPELRRSLAARGRRAVETQAEAWSRDRLTSMPFGSLADPRGNPN